MDKHGKNKGHGKNANAVEATENWNEPPEQDPQQHSTQHTMAAGSLGLCGLGSNYIVPCRHQEDPWEQIEMTLDSGSAVWACLENVGEVSGFSAPARVQTRHRRWPRKHRRPKGRED